MFPRHWAWQSPMRALSRVSGRSRSRVESSRSLESELNVLSLDCDPILSRRIASPGADSRESRPGLTGHSPFFRQGARRVGGKKETRSRALSIQQVAVHVLRLGLCIDFFFSFPEKLLYSIIRGASVRLRVVEANKPKKKIVLCCVLSLLLFFWSTGYLVKLARAPWATFAFVHINLAALWVLMSEKSGSNPHRHQHRSTDRWWWWWWWACGGTV
jgi:hypothetical protein